MSRVPFARRVAGPLVALVVAVTGLAGLPATASAAGEHHAAVIVETGADVHRVVIAFSPESISGVEALQLAGADPQVAGFPGLGAGVCALYGVGHPATANDCLGTSTDPRFWAYWHVPAGRSGFDDSTFSRAGAGTVRVRDGDVEGWRFGLGEPPAFVLPDPPVADPPAVAIPSGDAPSPSGSDPAPGGAGAGGPASAPSVPGGSTTTSLATPPVAGGPAPAGGAARAATTSTTRSRAEVDGKRASALDATDDEEGGGGTTVSLVAFAVVLAVLALGIYLAHRARVGNRPSGP